MPLLCELQARGVRRQDPYHQCATRHVARDEALKKCLVKPHEPSRASLREMPEVNFDKARVRRNPYALGVAAEGISTHFGRGRPRKGTETGPTIPRSVGSFPGERLEASEKAGQSGGHPAARCAPRSRHGGRDRARPDDAPRQRL